MRITEGKLYRLALRTHTPFRIAFETLDVCYGILLELRTDEGITGFGEATPSLRITGETWEGSAAALQQAILPAIQGCDPFSIQEIHERMGAAAWGNPSAKAAVDIACYDLTGKASGRPVVSVLGGSPRNLPTDYTLGIAPPEEQAGKAETLVKQGFRILKIKLGAGGEEDIQRVKAVRRRVGESVILRVDANQGWSVQEALRVLEEISRYQIELVEQPVPCQDWEGMAFLRKRSPIPVAADESVHSPLDAQRAVEKGICDVINIKLMKCGGIYPALQIASLAEAANLSCMIGGMIGESRLAVSAAAHFAASRKVVRYFDLDADLLLRDDPVPEGGIQLEKGNRLIPSLPGLGITEFSKKFLELISKPHTCHSREGGNPIISGSPLS